MTAEQGLTFLKKSMCSTRKPLGLLVSILKKIITKGNYNNSLASVLPEDFFAAVLLRKRRINTSSINKAFSTTALKYYLIFVSKR